MYEVSPILAIFARTPGAAPVHVIAGRVLHPALARAETELGRHPPDVAVLRVLAHCAGGLRGPDTTRGGGGGLLLVACVGAG